MPQTANPLFSATDLTGLLHKQVSDASAALAEIVVWGWLQPILGLDERPAVLDDWLQSAAVELGCIACENPASLALRKAGPFEERWLGDRRDEILAAVGNGGKPVNPDAPPRPVGSFPPAHQYPDPARPIVPSVWFG